MEVIESAEVVEPVEKSKLEETCILVEGDMLHFVSHGTEKHKSYKVLSFTLSILSLFVLACFDLMITLRKRFVKHSHQN